eukprot:CAMPEP_0197549790 /NCGR_PEP_ID=MMETSP1320-20131121/3593_1 /TAXON_ID=91990 /ORGANISM="Bolidomonas sp., Strain RCC2347" /LENGTH=240 /DNA_ID=CAMNT_0043110069 /DNA_START=167 /DNA_END=886 /DNA_ORIENTATION=-
MPKPTTTIPSPLSSCSGFTVYTSSPQPSYTCYGLRKTLPSSDKRHLPPPPKRAKSLCAGYAVFREGGGGVCGLGMQLTMAENRRDSSSSSPSASPSEVHAQLPPEVREAIMREKRKDSRRTPKTPSNDSTSDAATPQPPPPPPSSSQPSSPPSPPPNPNSDKPPSEQSQIASTLSSVSSRLDKQLTTHRTFAFQLFTDVTDTLRDGFPARCKESATRMWERKGRTVEDVKKGVKKLFGMA